MWTQCISSEVCFNVIRLRFIDAAWTSLGTYMRELIVERKEELGASGSDAQLQRGDIFTRLVAGLSEDAKVGLEEQQVVSLSAA